MNLLAEMEQNQIISPQEIQEFRQFVQDTVTKTNRKRVLLYNEIDIANQNIWDGKISIWLLHDKRKTLIENAANDNIIDAEEKNKLIDVQHQRFR